MSMYFRRGTAVPGAGLRMYPREVSTGSPPGGFGRGQTAKQRPWLQWTRLTYHLIGRADCRNPGCLENGKHKCREHVGELEHWCCWWGWKMVWSLKKLQTESPCDPTGTLFSGESGAGQAHSSVTHRKMPRWRQAACPSMDERPDTVWKGHLCDGAGPSLKQGGSANACSNVDGP